MTILQLTSARSIIDHKRDAVILLHGLFATPRSMRKAERRLESEGYCVINWGYPTFWRTIDAHAGRLLPVLYALEHDSSVRSINFLTHSLGGILARYTLGLVQVTKLQRMVMLAPPNTGSHLTKFPLGPFARCVPVIAELSEAPTSLPNRLLAIPDLEIGIIAASSDVVVRVANTHLSYQCEHCIVAASHSQLPYLDAVLAKASNFLRCGSFSSSDNLRQRVA